MNYHLFSSESVCSGHPDKICDQVSDAILDAALSSDPNARVACETMVTTNKMILAGEITCTKKLPYKKIARDTIADLGYTKKEYEFGRNTDIEVYLHQQSLDIAAGVDTGGAGDQGMMFGYATNETVEYMPLPITMAHYLVQRMDDLSETSFPYLRPDGKAQVTIEYKKGKPIRITKIVLAKPHDPDIEKEEVMDILYKNIILPTLVSFRMPKVSITDVILNGTGIWTIGGPTSDTGVTGRKIVVDTYGGVGRIGGGCFSGKDPTKVDRSGAYAARFIAKNIVAQKLAQRCEVQLAYAIGHKDPVGKAIETFGTEKKSMKIIEDFAWDLLDLSVRGIITGLDLQKPIYTKTARYGHFGNPQYPWEKVL
jgi:S-adenosylmethionine synthetase